MHSMNILSDADNPILRFRSVDEIIPNSWIQWVEIRAYTCFNFDWLEAYR